MNESREEEEARSKEEQSETIESRGRRYKAGRRRVRCLWTRVGRKCCIGREGPDGQSWTVDAHKLEEPKEEDTMLVGVGYSGDSGTQ